MPACNQRRIRLSLAAFLVAAASFGAIAPGVGARNAYVTNAGDGSVSVINAQTNEVVKFPNGKEAITVGSFPQQAAITPDGRFAYVTNAGDGTVSVINTQTNEVVKFPNGKEAITVGSQPEAIAITPDGRLAYVANFLDSSVSVIDTKTNEVVAFQNGKKAITVGAQPRGIAITPDGHFAYVADFGIESVSVINTQTNEVVKLRNGKDAIRVGEEPEGIAITPDGKFAYVANSRDPQNARGNSVSVINTQTNEVVMLRNGKEAIKVGNEPHGVAITPDGRFAYVANRAGSSVSVINTQTNEVVKFQNGEEAIAVHNGPSGIAFTPDGRFAYVTNAGNESVSVIDTQTNEVVKFQNVKEAIRVGRGPTSIAIAPDQPPLASFATLRARPGVPLTLDASGSKDPDGAISSYAWSFGDGQSQTLTSAGATHTFAKPGTYTVSLKETDAEGCSNSLIFTGQTASCAGNAAAQATKQVLVTYPGVKVKCPRGARPKGCTFKLQALVAKPRHGKRPKVESLPARLRVKAGRSTIVSLRPKKAFAKRLAAAKQVLVKEAVVAKGSTRTRLVKLKIVQ